MLPEHIHSMKPSDLCMSQLNYNDQGSMQWYKEKYPMFPDEYYEILELYSLGGVRYKEFRNLIKRLEKKGKIQRPDKKQVEMAFSKINLSAEDNSVDDELPANTISLSSKTNLPQQQICDLDPGQRPE